MSKKMEEQKKATSKKKYILLALVFIVGIYALLQNNRADENISNPGVKTEKVQSQNIEPQKEKNIAHVDIFTKLVNEEEPQFEVYINNSEEAEKQAPWMPQSGRQGYFFQGDAGQVDILILALKDSDINIKLISPFEQDIYGSVVEKWVKYTAFSVNDEQILKETVSLCYTKPFIYTINAKAGEKYKLHIEWIKDKE